MRVNAGNIFRNVKKSGGYFAWDEYNSDRERLGRVVDQLVDNTYSALSGSFNTVYDSLMRGNDEFFVLKDFRAYVESWHRLEKLYGGIGRGRGCT